MSSNQKLIVVVGATGVQGGGVVNSFLKDPSWRVRALTRNTNSAKSQALAAKSPNVELATADINDLSSLIKAFEGAHAIFGMTDFWNLYGDTSNREHAEKKNQFFPEWVHDKEVRQGKNIFEAAAQVPSLERLVFSGLSNASKWSGGKYKNVLHFDSKAFASEWAQEQLPEVWAKTSVLQVGMYLENFMLQPMLKPQKDGDTYVFKMFGSSDAPYPWVAAEEETGSLTYALVTQLPAGKNVVGYREYKSMNYFVELWGKALGKKTRVETGGLANMPEELGLELTETFAYAREFGYWGNDPSVVRPEDLGVKLEIGTIEEWIHAQDWREILDQ